MPEKRSVSENHGDYTYTVEKLEDKVVSYRTPLNAPDSPDEQVTLSELPSASLKEALVNYSADFGDEVLTS